MFGRYLILLTFSTCPRASCFVVFFCRQAAWQVQGGEIGTLIRRRQMIMENRVDGADEAARTIGERTARFVRRPTDCHRLFLVARREYCGGFLHSPLPMSMPCRLGTRRRAHPSIPSLPPPLESEKTIAAEHTSNLGPERNSSVVLEVAFVEIRMRCSLLERKGTRNKPASSWRTQHKSRHWFRPSALLLMCEGWVLV